MYLVTKTSIINVNPNNIDSVFIVQNVDNKTFTILIQLEFPVCSGDSYERTNIAIECTDKNSAETILDDLIKSIAEDNSNIKDWREIEAVCTSMDTYSE